MRQITEIVVHCSDSDFGCASMIRNWHVRGNGWSDIGYHFVIPNGYIQKDFYVPSCDGALEVGRPIEVAGAHARAVNRTSIGICLIGTKEFTTKQFDTLYYLLNHLIMCYNIKPSDIYGHYEVPDNGGKTCPNIEMKVLRDTLLQRRNEI